MKKIHITILALVLLLTVSLVFAQPAGTKTVVRGDVAAMNTPTGVVVEGEQVAVTTPLPKHTAAHVQTAKHHAQAAHQQASNAATQAQNAASLKKGEPKVKINTTTTDTDTVNVNIKNKRGVTDYGMVEQTVTNPQGQKTTQGMVYGSYTPSKAALTNDKLMEVSLGGGMTATYNKDNRSDRYSAYGLAAGLNSVYYVSNYLAVGLDYMMLHPRAKTRGAGADERRYHGIYAHNISLAGKLTINPWNNLRFYSPMGVGMMNGRMKTETAGAEVKDDKWGASFYIGAGMQYDVTDWMFAGVEYRYTYGFVSDKDLTPFAKDRDLQFHTVMIRVGTRF